MTPTIVASLVNLGGPDAVFLAGGWFFLWIPMAIVHIAFAIGVGADAARMRDHQVGTFLVGGWMWALATLLGGFVVVAIYWLIHHSTLRPLPPPKNL